MIEHGAVTSQRVMGIILCSYGGCYLIMVDHDTLYYCMECMLCIPLKSAKMTVLVLTNRRCFVSNPSRSIVCTSSTSSIWR